MSLGALSACGQLISGYSLAAYTNATRLKAETLALVDQSAEPYAQHSDDVHKLQIELDAAYEFSRGTPKNGEAAAIWRIIRNPDPRHTLLGTFYAIWRDAPAGLSEAYRNGKKANVTLAFDRLICLEANKKEKTTCPDLPGGTYDSAPEIVGNAAEPANE